MSDLRGLIERVERLEGQNRDIDRALERLAYGDDVIPFTPDYTRSVDAALALVEKMRPGYRWGVSSVAIKIGAYPDGKTAYGEGFRAHVTKNSPLRPMPSTADAPTPALAIILALLRSLLNTTEGGEAE